MENCKGNLSFALHLEITNVMVHFIPSGAPKHVGEQECMQDIGGESTRKETTSKTET
jgi:hypothetical protein